MCGGAELGPFSCWVTPLLPVYGMCFLNAISDNSLVS